MWKSPCTQYRRNVALTTTCIKNGKFKIIKTRTGCQYVGNLHHIESLNWDERNLRVGRTLLAGRELDIAGLELD